MSRIKTSQRYSIKTIGNSTFIYDKDKYRNFPYDIVANFYENESLARKAVKLLNKELSK